MLCFDSFVFCFDDFVLCFDNFVVLYDTFVFCFTILICVSKILCCVSRIVCCVCRYGPPYSTNKRARTVFLFFTVIGFRCLPVFVCSRLSLTYREYT